jgi:hypothetical protein
VKTENERAGVRTRNFSSFFRTTDSFWPQVEEREREARLLLPDIPLLPLQPSCHPPPSHTHTHALLENTVSRARLFLWENGASLITSFHDEMEKRDDISTSAWMMIEFK